MDINTIRGIYTILFFAMFIGICIWAWSGKRKKDFEDAANLPFKNDREDTSNPDSSTHEGQNK